MSSPYKINTELDDLIFLGEMDVTYHPERGFITLDAWKKAREVRSFFYNDILPFLPAEEKNNLNIQIRRAAVSATANIAEGYGKYNAADEIRFYLISRGSQNELLDHLITCSDLKFINEDLFESGKAKLTDSIKILNGYINWVIKTYQNKNGKINQK